MGYRDFFSRNRKFESISLQRRVSKLSVPRSGRARRRREGFQAPKWSASSPNPPTTISVAGLGTGSARPAGPHSSGRRTLPATAPGPRDAAPSNPAHPICRLNRRGIPRAGAAPYRGAEPCAGRDSAGAHADASVLRQLRGAAPSRRACRINLSI